MKWLGPLWLFLVLFRHHYNTTYNPQNSPSDSGSMESGNVVIEQVSDSGSDFHLSDPEQYEEERSQQGDPEPEDAPDDEGEMWLGDTDEATIEDIMAG